MTICFCVPLCSSPSSLIDIQIGDVKDTTDNWCSSATSTGGHGGCTGAVQGPFRYHQQTLQEYWLEQQIPTGTKATEEAFIANNGLYLESFSSSTDPSFYRATTSHDDTNLDDYDDFWLQKSTSPSGGHIR